MPPPPPPPPPSEGRSIESISPTPIIPSSESIKSTPSKGIRRINETTDEEGFSLDFIRVETDVPPLVPMPSQSTNQPTVWHSSVFSKRAPPVSASSSPNRRPPPPSTPDYGNSTLKRMIKGAVRPPSLPRSLPPVTTTTSTPTTTSKDSATPDRAGASTLDVSSMPTPMLSSKASMAIAPVVPRAAVNTSDIVSAQLSNKSSASTRSGSELLDSDLKEEDGGEQGLETTTLLRESTRQALNIRTDARKDFFVDVFSTKPSTPSAAGSTLSSSSTMNKASQGIPTSGGSYHTMERTFDSSISPTASDISMGSTGSPTVEDSTMEEHDSVPPGIGSQVEKPASNAQSTTWDNGMLSLERSRRALTPRASTQREAATYDLTMSPAHIPTAAAKPVTIDLTESPAKLSVRSERSRSSSLSSSQSEMLDSSIAASVGRDESDFEVSDEEEEQNERADAVDGRDLHNPNGILKHTAESLGPDGPAALQNARDRNASVASDDDALMEDSSRNQVKQAPATDEDLDDEDVEIDDNMIETLRRMDRERESSDGAVLVNRLEYFLKALNEGNLDKLPKGHHETFARLIMNNASEALGGATRIRSLLGRYPVHNDSGEVIPLSEKKKRTASRSSAEHVGSPLEYARENGRPRSSSSLHHRNGHLLSRESSSINATATDQVNDSESEWTEDEISLYTAVERHVAQPGVEFVPIDPSLQPTRPSSSNPRTPGSRLLRNSRDLNGPSVFPLLGLPDAWPKDGRNVNLKHIQAYYGLSQDEAKEFLTNAAVAKAMDRIQLLKTKYEKPSVPSINTVRQAFKYDAKFGIAPRDFISEYRSALCDLTLDVPNILYNPRTKERLKDDDMGANAHSVLLAAKRYRNRIEGTVPSTKKSPTALRADGEDSRVQNGNYQLFFSRQDSPTEMRQQSAVVANSPFSGTPRPSRAPENWAASAFTKDSAPPSQPLPRQSVTLPFRQEEGNPNTVANLIKDPTAVIGGASAQTVSANQSTADKNRHREESMSESVTSMNTENSLLRSDELRVASTTSLSTVTAGPTEADDDMFLGDEPTSASAGDGLPRFGRRKPGAVSMRDQIVTELVSVTSFPAKNRAAQLRLARKASSTILEKINEKRAEKLKNEKELEELEEQLNLKLSEIARRMEKMRSKAAFHGGNEVDLLTDEDLELVEGENGSGPSPDRHLAKIDWNKYQELADERLRLETDCTIKRTRLIANGRSIESERDDFIEMRLDLVRLEKNLEETASADGNNSPMSLLSGTKSSFKIQEDPLVASSPAGNTPLMGDRLLDLFDSVAATTKRSEQVEHGYSTRKRVASIFGTSRDKRRKL